LGKFSNSVERIEALKKQSFTLREELGKVAFELSSLRIQSAKSLIEQVNNELADLKMEQVKFDVSIYQKKSLSGIPSPYGDSYEFTRKGVDVVEFMASTNPGEPLKPLAKIASTGEIYALCWLSRVHFQRRTIFRYLFSMKSISGWGAGGGEVIGEKLWALARDRQVLCITHLPQIAVFCRCASRHSQEHRRHARFYYTGKPDGRCINQ
jgi:DNA repair protein RecN (Recombination protein N)